MWCRVVIIIGIKLLKDLKGHKLQRRSQTITDLRTRDHRETDLAGAVADQKTKYSLPHPQYPLGWHGTIPTPIELKLSG